MASPEQQRDIQDCIKKLNAPELFVKEYALRILINYAVDRVFQNIIRNLGGIEPIIPLLQHENRIIQMLAAWALSNLALEDANRVAILKGGVVKHIVPVLGTASNGDVVTKYLWLLTNLANNEANRKFLTVCGIPKILSNLLKYPSESVLIELCKPLRNMLMELEAQKSFAQSGGILNLVRLLTSNNQELLLELMEVVLTICVGTDIMRKVVVAAGILPPLVYSLSSGNDAVLLQSLKVLITLSLTEENELKILNARAIPPIVDLFCSRKPFIQNEAALLLSNLTCNEKIREGLRYSGVVSPLIEALSSNNLQIQEQAARLITNLAMDDYNRMELIDAGAIQALNLLNNICKEPTIKEVIGFALNNLEIVAIPEALKEPNFARSLSVSGTFLGRPSDPNRTKSISPESSTTSKSTSSIKTVSPTVVTPSSSSKKVTPQLSRREKIARELLETEKSYVNSLNIAIKYYLQPITDSVVKSSQEPIIPAEDVKSIFSIIEIIAKVNSTFLIDLDTRMRSWDHFSTTVGDLLDKFTEKFNVYSRYITNYDTTMNVYGLCLKDYPKFAEFIFKTKEIPEVRGLDLLSYLIMPVQRIPRYILLVQDLIKHTPSDHPDSHLLNSALVKTKNAADRLNEDKRQAERVNKVYAIQELFVEPDVIAGNGRFFVREGTFILKESNKGSKYCHLILLNDMLLYTHETKQHKYKVKDKIPLSDVFVAPIQDTPELKNAFAISWSKGSIVVSANSDSEQQVWVNDLRSKKFM